VKLCWLENGEIFARDVASQEMSRDVDAACATADDANLGMMGQIVSNDFAEEHGFVG
jgi:hypothetical protein